MTPKTFSHGFGLMANNNNKSKQIPNMNNYFETSQRIGTQQRDSKVINII